MTLYLNQGLTYTDPTFQVLLASSSLTDYLKIKELGNLVYMNTDINDAEDHKLYNHYFSVYNGTYSTARTNSIYIGRTCYDFSTPSSISNVKNGNTYFSLSTSTSNITYKDPHMVYNSSDESTPWYLFHENPATKAIRLAKSSNLAFWSTCDCSDVITHSSSGWEKKDISGPMVIYDTDTWYMYYCARGGGCVSAIKYATSADCSSWTKQSIVLDPANISWADRISPDDVIKVGDTYYMLFHGRVSGSGPSSYGYVANEYGEYWTIGVASSSSLTSGWSDALSDYYKPFGETDYDYHIQGGQGMFFVKNSGSDNVGSFYYYSDGNSNSAHDGIIMMTVPTTDNDTYEDLTISLDLSRYSDS